MKRGGRRIITRVIVFLLLGAIVNVAVAWGCAIWSPYSGDSHQSELHGARWPRRVPDGWPMPQARVWDSGPLGLSQEVYAATRLDISNFESVGIAATLGPDMWMLSIYASGWPVKSMDRADRYRNHWQFDGLMLPAWCGKDASRRLPLRPIWPGFAINTVFYAAILWGLFAAPFALRRRLRIKRGLCPACGYDLRGRAVGGRKNICPECGDAVATRLSTESPA